MIANIVEYPFSGLQILDLPIQSTTMIAYWSPGPHFWSTLTWLSQSLRHQECNDMVKVWLFVSGD